MKKFLFSFLTPLLVSLFFFIPQVKADTDITISQTDISTYDSFNWSNDLSVIETYMSNNNYSYYVITSGTNINERKVYLYSSIPTFVNINSSNPGLVSSFSWDSALSCSIYRDSTFICNGTSSPVYIRLFWDTSTFETSCRTNYMNPCFLTSNFEIQWNSSTFVLNISNGTYTFSMNENTHWLGLYDAIHYTPPISPDNTPVLTAFYTLVIDKLSVIADFFTDNIYLFALPLIPIFILCIYLIKRSLIK